MYVAARDTGCVFVRRTLIRVGAHQRYGNRALPSVYALLVVQLGYNYLINLRRCWDWKSVVSSVALDALKCVPCVLKGVTRGTVILKGASIYFPLVVCLVVISHLCYFPPSSGNEQIKPNHRHTPPSHHCEENRISHLTSDQVTRVCFQVCRPISVCAFFLIKFYRPTGLAKSLLITHPGTAQSSGLNRPILAPPLTAVLSGEMPTLILSTLVLWRNGFQEGGHLVFPVNRSLTITCCLIILLLWLRPTHQHGCVHYLWSWWQAVYRLRSPANQVDGQCVARCFNSRLP